MATKTINSFHNSNFKVLLSDLPTLESQTDTYLYNDFIRGISLPSYSMSLLTSNFKGETTLHNAGSRNNEDLGEVSITFGLTEDLLNYFYMTQFMMDTRYAENDSKDEDPRMKNNYIDSIVVDFLSNQKLVNAKIKYSKCFPTNISGLDLQVDNGDEMRFTVTFKYEEMHFNTEETSI